MNENKTNTEDVQQEHILSVESRDGLAKFTETFRPTDVKFLLALNSQFSVNDCRANAMGMLDRLKKFYDNGNSCDGLDFSYSQIRTI